METGCLLSTHLTGSLIFYQRDTEGGSSGSPVFKEVNNVPKIVTVHRGGCGNNETSGANIGSCVSAIIHHITIREVSYSMVTVWCM